MIELVTGSDSEVASKLKTLDRYLGDILVALPLGLLRRWRYDNASCPSAHIIVQPFHTPDVLGPIDPNKVWFFGVGAVREAYEAVPPVISGRNMKSNAATQWDALKDTYGRWSSVAEYLEGYLRKMIGEVRYGQLSEEFQARTCMHDWRHCEVHTIVTWMTCKSLRSILEGLFHRSLH